VTKPTGVGRGVNVRKPRYTLAEHQELEQELKGLCAALQDRISDVRRAYPTAHSSALGYPLRVRLETSLKKLHQALEEAETLKYNDHPGA